MRTDRLKKVGACRQAQITILSCPYLKGVSSQTSQCTFHNTDNWSIWLIHDEGAYY
jgi:hypothetical protein